MQQVLGRQHTALDDPVVRLAGFGDRVEVLGQDCGMSDGETAVLADPRVEGADIGVPDSLTRTAFVIHFPAVGATTAEGLPGTHRLIHFHLAEEVGHLRIGRELRSELTLPDDADPVA